MIRNERGMALALVIFALATLSVLIVGVFFLTFSELRSGRGTKGSAQALGVAEQGVEATLANAAGGAYDAMPVNSPITSAAVNLGGGQSYTTTVRRMSQALFLVTSEGRVTRGGKVRSRAQVGLLTRINKLDLQVHAAITVLNGISISGNADIDGYDQLPNANWGSTCPAVSPGTGMPGIAWGGTQAPQFGGSCPNASCITGNPAVYQDPTVTSNTFTVFGNLTWSQLVGMSTLTLTGNTYTQIQPSYTAATPAACLRTDDHNWGAPLGPATDPCFNYFPIIYSPGDLHVSNGRGQGILLVNGNLVLSGGMEFYGIVIVQGSVSSQGTGGHVYGTLQAAQANLDVSSISGNSVVNYSSCAIDRALGNTSTVAVVGERRWAMLY